MQSDVGIIAENIDRYNVNVSGISEKSGVILNFFLCFSESFEFLHKHLSCS